MWQGEQALLGKHAARLLRDGRARIDHFNPGTGDAREDGAHRRKVRAAEDELVDAGVEQWLDVAAYRRLYVCTVKSSLLCQQHELGAPDGEHLDAMGMVLDQALQVVATGRSLCRGDPDDAN